MPSDPDAELSNYLSSRLQETTDWADFKRAAPRAADAPAEVERVIELPGHLGGRTVRDRFVRGAAPVPPPLPRLEEAGPAQKPRLEAHLQSRLAEVRDGAFERAADPKSDPIEAYKQLRRQLGG